MGKESSRGTASTAIVRVKWRSRTAGFTSGSVETIIQKACKHFRLSAIQSDVVLFAQVDDEQLEVTDDLLGILPKGTTFTLSHIQHEDVPSERQPPPPKEAKQKDAVDHVCAEDLRENRASSSCIPRALGTMVFIAPLVGTKFALECEHAETIEDVKVKIEDRTGMSRNLQRLLFRGLELEEGRTLSDYNILKENTLHLVARQVGGKPVVYLFPLSPIPDATVSVSLVPQWSFSHVYPPSAPKQAEDGRQRIAWSVSAQPDGTLVERDTKLELSYLFWEAESNPSIPPSPPLDPVDARTEHFEPAYPVLDCDTPTVVLLPFSELLPYLDAELKKLSLHTAARNDFITYWLPKLSKKPFVALRFLPQSAYERAAKLDVHPKPDAVTRVFMLFRGVCAEDAEKQMWSTARARVGEVDWVKVVGVQVGAWDERRFRVLEWGAMEVM